MTEAVGRHRGHATTGPQMIAPTGAPADRYVVLDYLSEGGMGAIYIGKKLGAGGFEKEVVLKQLLPEFTQQEEFIDLFLREARLSATLDHANIIHTIDLVTAGDDYFIVMEYLAGADVRTLLKRAQRRGTRLSPAAAMYIMREILSALAYAHVKRDWGGNPLRLIHRDVSPANILLSTSGEVKLTDFGIAKAATHTSGLFDPVKGKIGYMSPEQARSEPIDHRSDLYSLAVCLYEALTAERLFVHSGLFTKASEIYAQPIPPVSSKVAGLPPALDAVMIRALSVDPDARFQTAGEFHEALLRIAHRNGLLMSPPELAAHLTEICGAPATWRDEDHAGDDLAPRPATEVYEGPGEGSNDGSSLSKMLGVELTSIIAILEGEAEGAAPLVDFDEPQVHDAPEFLEPEADQPAAIATPAPRRWLSVLAISMAVVVLLGAGAWAAITLSSH